MTIGFDAYASGYRRQSEHLSIKGNHAAMPFKISLQAQHESVGIDDSSAVGEDAANCSYFGFKFGDVLRTQPRQFAHTICFCLTLIYPHGLEFFGPGGNDQFSATIEGYLMFCTILIKQAFACDTQTRLKRVGCVAPLNVLLAASCKNSGDANWLIG